MADDDTAPNGQKRITVTLSADEHQLLRTIAFHRGRSLSQAARRLIQEGIYDETAPGAVLTESSGGAALARFKRDELRRRAGLNVRAGGEAEEAAR